MKVPITLLNTVGKIGTFSNEEILELIIIGFTSSDCVETFKETVKRGLGCLFKVLNTDYPFLTQPLSPPNEEINDLVESRGMQMFYQSLLDIIPSGFTLTVVECCNDRKEVIFHGYQ